MRTRRLLAAAACLAVAAAARPGEQISATVTRIVDGDTLRRSTNWIGR